MSGVVYPPRWANWVIRSFYWIFKTIGLASISLHSKPKTKRPFCFATSKFDQFYNVLLSCSLFALSFVTLPNLSKESYVYKTNMISTIEMVQATFGVLMMCTIILYYVFRCSTVERVCNYLIHVEEQFRFSQTPISLKRTFRNLLMVSVFQMNLCVASVVLEYNAFQDGPLVWATNIMPAAFASSVLFQYFSVISVINTYFIHVNFSIRMCMNLKPNDCWKSTSRCRQIFDSSITVQTIRRLRNIHDELCDVCSVISQFYSFPCLLVVSTTFYALLFNSYYLLLPLVLPNDEMNILVSLSTACFTFYLICPLGILASKITDLLNEIQRTAIVVHSFLKAATHREIKSELKQFSLQLLNRQIKFTVSGYFNLDNSLFQSLWSLRSIDLGYDRFRSESTLFLFILLLQMLSTVVTYLVILIQYEVGNSAVHVCNCNCQRE